VYDVNPKQALCLSNMDYLEKFTLGSINRDINIKWVQEIKKNLLHMHAINRRTTITLCIDVRDIQIALTDPEAAKDFKAVICDGQHRVNTLKELKKENPEMKYEFWLVVYVIESEDEMKKLLFDLDKRLDITPSDKKQIEIRKTFITAFTKLTEGHDKRRCVQRTKNHAILRNEEVIRALSHLTEEHMRVKIIECSEYYKKDYEDAGIAKISPIYIVIEATKLYQLVNWQSGAWIKKMLEL
jgi:hypothetical protein